MRFERRTLQLPEGNFNTTVQFFEEEDRGTLAEIYRSWKALNRSLAPIHSRKVNLPEGLSEGTFCLEMNTGRRTKSIPGANSSFDCYDFRDNTRIQVKACSILPDLTSFGPKSEWEKLYFCDFSGEETGEGTYHIYLIDNNDIYTQEVKAGETVRDQQLQGRRPRFSIYTKIILAQSIAPTISGRLFE